jgi:phosphoserine phosphatase
MKNRIKLVIFDLDDTLTNGATIWELIHKQMGTWESHGIGYWRDFEKGAFGYNAFIRRDVACWKGLPLSKVKKAIAKIRYVPHIKKTIGALKKKRIKIALISSGLELLAASVSKKFGLDHVHANTLEMRDGKLTGKVCLTVPGLGKGRVTRYLRKKLNLRKSEAMAVGDSRYDIPMFREVGESVSFTDAGRDVKKHASHIIPKNNLYELVKIVEQRDSIFC